MNTTPAPIDPNATQHAETACGEPLQVTPQTSSIFYQGEVVYFCAEDCRQLYTEDPFNSCLASRLLSGK